MYNVRGTFTNQRKYSQHGFHQLLELARVKALDTIEIENQVKARVKKMERAGVMGGGIMRNMYANGTPYEMMDGKKREINLI